MTAQPPPAPDNTSGAAPDLGYDLAHDVHGIARLPAAGPPVRVVTQAQDDGGGDYGYDLAHDVPRA